MKKLSSAETQTILKTLGDRFAENMVRHPGLDWAKIAAKLEKNPEKLWSLNEMEKTGGDPDVTGYDQASDHYFFTDCAPETPKGRCSLCYDDAALQSRKKFKPRDSAVNLATAMGIELLTPEEYEALQKLGSFDLKTSSWLKTPTKIRKLGGALFGDRRYDTVFFYHNGADSYYAVRGFRGLLKV